MTSFARCAAYVLLFGISPISWGQTSTIQSGFLGGLLANTEAKAAPPRAIPAANFKDRLQAACSAEILRAHGAPPPAGTLQRAAYDGAMGITFVGYESIDDPLGEAFSKQALQDGPGKDPLGHCLANERLAILAERNGSVAQPSSSQNPSQLQASTGPASAVPLKDTLLSCSELNAPKLMQARSICAEHPACRLMLAAQDSCAVATRFLDRLAGTQRADAMTMMDILEAYLPVLVDSEKLRADVMSAKEAARAARTASDAYKSTFQSGGRTYYFEGGMNANRQWSGPGFMVSPSGQLMVGNYRNGKLDGPGLSVSSGGGVLAGKWMQGKPGGRMSVQTTRGEVLLSERVWEGSQVADLEDLAEKNGWSHLEEAGPQGNYLVRKKSDPISTPLRMVAAPAPTAQAAVQPAPAIVATAAAVPNPDGGIRVPDLTARCAGPIQTMRATVDQHFHAKARARNTNPSLLRTMREGVEDMVSRAKVAEKELPKQCTDRPDFLQRQTGQAENYRNSIRNISSQISSVRNEEERARLIHARASNEYWLCLKEGIIGAFSASCGTNQAAPVVATSAIQSPGGGFLKPDLNARCSSQIQTVRSTAEQWYQVAQSRGPSPLHKMRESAEAIIHDLVSMRGVDLPRQCSDSARLLPTYTAQADFYRKSAQGIESMIATARNAEQRASFTFKRSGEILTGCMFDGLIEAVSASCSAGQPGRQGTSQLSQQGAVAQQHAPAGSGSGGTQAAAGNDGAQGATSSGSTQATSGAAAQGSSTSPVHNARQERGHIKALEATHCVKLVTVAKGDSRLSGGGRLLSNQCGETVEVSWCHVETECGRSGNSWTLGAGRSWPVSAHGEVRYAACRGKNSGGLLPGSAGTKYRCTGP